MIKKTVRASQDERFGRALRDLIRAHCKRNGRSYAHLSRQIEMDDNYVSAYLNGSPRSWGIPKHPTFGLLLKEIDSSEEALADLVSQQTDESS